MTADDVIAMARSRSYYIAGTEERRARVDEGLTQLITRLPEFAEIGRIDMPYVTRAYRVRRPQPNSPTAS